MTPYEPKSFWKRPEGKAGMIFGIAILGGLAFVIANFATAIITFLGQTLAIGIGVILLAAIVYMILDPRMRNLVWYGYKSVMRFITGMFVQIDPIGILKNYVDDLRENLRKMSKQIGNLRGQMRRMKTMMEKNSEEMNNQLKLAKVAQEKGNTKVLTLSTRKAARLKETNQKYAVLHKKMEVMYRVLEKMYQNSEILLEDTKDEVQIKEQERKAIRASHSAMMSARNIIAGKGDRREMFDMALESIAEDVSNKIGEMERFMDVSTNFMDSMDLQNGVFEEQGLQMLEAWEKESESLLLGDEKSRIINEGNSSFNLLDEGNMEIDRAENNNEDSKYDDFFS